MSKVLVTGGAGFLGSHLCERLLDDGHDVLCVDNYFTGTKRNVAHLMGNPMFELMRHDVTFPLYVEVDQIYNLACPASPIHYQHDPVQTTKTSVHGAINMLGLAKRVKARILQASTSEVYGDPEVHPQTEDYWGHVNPIGIRSCYDEGKRCAETLFFDYHRQHDLDIKVMRIFNTYGPRMHPNDGRVVSNFIVQALRGEPITIYGDGPQTRSFCYVDDLIEGMVRLMDTPHGVHRSGQRRQPRRVHDARARERGDRADRRDVGADLQGPAVRRPEAAPARHRAGPGRARLGAEGRARRGPDPDDRLLPVDARADVASRPRARRPSGAPNIGSPCPRRSSPQTSGTSTIIARPTAAISIGCVSSLPSGAQPALSSSATPDMVSTTTMPRRMNDCGTRGAIVLPIRVPGTEPITSGISSSQSRPCSAMLEIAAASTSGTAWTRSVPTSRTARARGRASAARP